VEIRRRNSGETQILWSTGYAGSEPIVRYEVHRSGQKVLTRPFAPQTSDEPWDFMDNSAAEGEEYIVRVVDRAGRTADSKKVSL
jgi:hypothetical protein